jgi:hypothetical protein
MLLSIGIVVDNTISNIMWVAVTELKNLSDNLFDTVNTAVVGCLCWAVSMLVIDHSKKDMNYYTALTEQ